jgi:hypothetical protein
VAGVLRGVPFVVGVMLQVVHVAEVAQHSGCVVLVFHSRLRIRVQMNAGVGWSHNPFESRCR